jgi:hypothetical protein
MYLEDEMYNNFCHGTGILKVLVKWCGVDYSIHRYHNYKNFHSVLQAVADRKCIAVDVGDYSQSSDGGIFKELNFNKLLVTNGLNVPNQSCLQQN